MNIRKAFKVKPKRVFAIVTLVSFIVSTTFSFDVKADSDRVVYPLKEISKLDCRFEDFSSLWSKCKEMLPILKTKDYKKYIKKEGGYNKYTRLYTVLWGSSYKYGWDIWNGGHEGVDIATAQWTPVYTIADWTVIVAKKDPSWWNVISIEHTIRWKKIVSNYAHLSKIDVKKWQKVKVWTQIGEVWSTWNSTGNHLHFQVDLEHLFHPFYYSWKTCPYGYYKVTESWICFDELAENTLDPLKFLESEWGMLDNIDVKISKKWKQKNKKTKKSPYKQWFDMTIFEKTIHTEMWSLKWDVRQVQIIYKDLGFYTWKIDWDYSSIEEAIIAFQLKNKVIASRDELWAGWFGPKTRAHTKSKYIQFLGTTAGEKRGAKKVFIWNKNKATIIQKVEKISRKNILSREEIEKREMDNFMKNNVINMALPKIGGNVKIWEKLQIKLEVLKKINRKKTRFYKWTLPAGMTFEYDKNILSVFPEKISYISRWVRDIELKWKKTGNTQLKVKLWKKVIKTFDIKVVWENTKVYPKTAKIYSQKHIILWEERRAIALFKDTAWKKLVNLPFKGTFILETWENTKVCIKRGNIKNIQKIFGSECKDTDYEKNPEITYADTVWWLLLFNYKALSKKSLDISLVGKSSRKIYASLDLEVENPRGLSSTYRYFDETVAMLEDGVISWMKRGYFMQEKDLVEKDAFVWVENALLKIKAESINPDTQAQVSKKLVELHKQKKQGYKKITRKDFLDTVYKYLVINDTSIGLSIEYKDLMEEENKKANAIFDKDNTWKDKFGETHFQPKQHLTRGEWAYLLSKALEKSAEMYLTLK